MSSWNTFSIALGCTKILYMYSMAFSVVSSKNMHVEFLFTMHILKMISKWNFTKYCFILFKSYIPIQSFSKLFDSGQYVRDSILSWISWCNKCVVSQLFYFLFQSLQIVLPCKVEKPLPNMQKIVILITVVCGTNKTSHKINAIMNVNVFFLYMFIKYCAYHIQFEWPAPNPPLLCGESWFICVGFHLLCQSLVSFLEDRNSGSSTSSLQLYHLSCCCVCSWSIYSLCDALSNFCLCEPILNSPTDVLAMSGSTSFEFWNRRCSFPRYQDCIRVFFLHVTSVGSCLGWEFLLVCVP